MGGHSASAAEGQPQHSGKGFVHTMNNFVKNAKPFLAGFSIGMVQGAVNKGAEHLFISDMPHVAERQHMRRRGINMTSWIATDYITRKYEPLLKYGKPLEGFNDNYKRTLLGRGAGQLATEMLINCWNGKFDPQALARGNFSLNLYMVFYILDWITSKSK